MPENVEAAASAGKMAAGMRNGEDPALHMEGTAVAFEESDDGDTDGKSETRTERVLDESGAAMRSDGESGEEEQQEAEQVQVGCGVEVRPTSEAKSREEGGLGNGAGGCVIVAAEDSARSSSVKVQVGTARGQRREGHVVESQEAMETWREQIDLGRRTRLQRIILVPRVIKQRNDLGVPTIKSDWEPAAAQLGLVAPPRVRKLRGKDVEVLGTPPGVALGFIQGVLDLLESMELHCMGLPEANGNEIRWRLMARAQRWCGTVLDFAFQLKQGSILDWLPAGGVGPSAVRGMPVDALLPQDAPGGYPDEPGFPNECSRLALVFVMTGARESYGRRVLCLLDCASFINMSELTLMLVTEHPHDFASGWLARSVQCPSVFYQPREWRRLFLSFFRNLDKTHPRLWARYANRPIVEFIEDLKAMRESIPLARLVLGWGFNNKSEVFARALLVLEQREKTRPWVLATLARYVMQQGWLEDLADVYITFCHDTLYVYGPSMAVQFHHIPKIDQLCTRYQMVFQQASARLLKRGDSRYQHHQLFVRADDFLKLGSAAEKEGIAESSGGDWKLDGAGTPVNPETTLASCTVGWHSKKTIMRMAAENTVIPPRETIVDGQVFLSPAIDQPRKRNDHVVGRIEQLNRSWSNGGWQKRRDKYLTSQPFQRGFLVKEPLRERAVGLPVRCYFPQQDEASWGEVVDYDAESEYYVVVYEDGQVDEMVWVQLIGYLHQPRKTPQQVSACRHAKNERRRERAKEDEEKLARMRAKRARYLLRQKELVKQARSAPAENREFLERKREQKRAKNARRRERQMMRHGRS